MTGAYIYDAVRTPFGKFNGALSGIRPDDLAASALKAITERSPGLDPASIDEIVLGNANGAGEDNRNVVAPLPCSPVSRCRCPARPSTACVA